MRIRDRQPSCGVVIECIESSEDVCDLDPRLASPVAFAAAKYTAFLDRGNRDYHGSHDLEDFITVVDGRAGIVADVERAPLGLHRFVVTSIRQFVSDLKFQDALPGYLQPEEEGRIGLIRSKLEGIANLPNRVRDEPIDSGT